MICTYDLRDFRLRELALATELLSAHLSGDRNEAKLGTSIQLGFNRNSGKVFLADEDYRVAMMYGGFLLEWHSCHECGHEGFAEDFFDEASSARRCTRCGVLYLGPLA